MKGITTATDAVVAGSAIGQLLIAEHWLTVVCAAANTTVSERASYAHESAFALSGGGLNRDANGTGITDLLHHTAPAVVAFVLHHLGAVLGDLTDKQQAQLDAAAAAIGLRVCEHLTALTAVQNMTTLAAGVRRRLAPWRRGGGSGGAADGGCGVIDQQQGRRPASRCGRAPERGRVGRPVGHGSFRVEWFRSCRATRHERRRARGCASH
ncbi:hypothetical protein ACWHA1_13820 [Streptomyces decoyicus]